MLSVEIRMFLITCILTYIGRHMLGSAHGFGPVWYVRSISAAPLPFSFFSLTTYHMLKSHVYPSALTVVWKY